MKARFEKVKDAVKWNVWKVSAAMKDQSAEGFVDTASASVRA